MDRYNQTWKVTEDDVEVTLNIKGFRITRTGAALGSGFLTLDRRRAAEKELAGGFFRGASRPPDCQ